MLLTVSHLSKRFGDQPVLRDISCGLAAGQVLAVLSRSGQRPFRRGIIPGKSQRPTTSFGCKAT